MNSARNTWKLERHTDVHNKSILWHHDGQNGHDWVVEWSAGCLHSHAIVSVYQQLEAVIFIATWISDFATKKDKWVPDCRICCIALKQNKYILHINRCSLLLGIRSWEEVALISKREALGNARMPANPRGKNAIKRTGTRQTKSTKKKIKLQFHLFELSQSVSCLLPFTIFTLPKIHLVYHPTLDFQKSPSSDFIWHNRCFQFFLGITVLQSSQ